MADDGAAERSSIEIRSLLRKLDPKAKDGGHKERVRRLARFRNYVTGSRKSTPEFYDDDLALLMLGSSAPSAILDEELVGLNLYGLLQACGSPSEDHEGGLKRSAKNAMTLLKYLVVDHVDFTDGQALQEAGELNGFAVALCSCTAPQLQCMNLHLHLGGDKRGGAPNDACEVIVLLLTKHLAEDGETPQPLTLEQLLPLGAARQAFDQWLTRTASRSVQQSVRAAIANAAKHKSPKKKKQEEEEEQEDAMNAFKKKQHRQKTEEEIQEAEKRDEALEKMGYDLLNISESERAAGPAMRWEDSKVYRAQKARKNAALKGSSIQSMRDLEEAAAEQTRLEEERKRMHARDPLGIRSEAFDLREVQKNRITLLEQAVKDLEEEMQEEEEQMEDEQEATQFLTNLASQKESLEALLDSLTGLKGVNARSPTGEDGKEGSSDGASVLPTDTNFDPLLFLTLVHRNASFQQLNDSVGRLSHKTDDQAVQLQNLVRDNFDLFIRCADGVDPFDERGKGGKKRESGMDLRLNDLEALSESCSEQARKSFKPLLDNTNEVRKVKTALTVLHRVTPILQAPTIMRQHLDNGRYSQAVKEYRRVLVIDEHCNIDLLNHVKAKAADAARDARRDLEARLAKENASVSSLMDGIRDLRELLELDVPENQAFSPGRSPGESKQDAKGASEEGTFDIGGTIIHFRDNTPALSCLLLQAAHFSLLVKKTIDQTEQTTVLIHEGQSLADLQSGEASAAARLLSPASKAESPPKPNPKATASTQWKYDVLDARVIATIRAVEIVRSWLPRLLRIGVAAHEDEKRRAARVGGRSAPVDLDSLNQLTAFEVVITNISPALSLIVDHAAFCALGSSTRASGAEVNMTFGRKAHEKLRKVLRTPLPPAQSSKCAKELAELVDVIVNSSTTADGLRPSNRESSPHFARLSPLEDTRVLAAESLNAVERRSCIYSLDVCARQCSAKASGSGKFDGAALLQCLQNLTEELARPEECTKEIEKGCEQVVRRICEGLAGYVRDRGDSARLRAVAECAEAFTTIVDVVREVGYLSNARVDAVEELMMEDIMGLEGAMFDEYLDNIRMNVENCTRIGWLDMEEGSQTPDRDMPPTFPPYLSASLLAIVRCRAQVERALGDKIRRSEGVSYQYLAMATAADGVVEDICAEVKERKQTMKVRQADRMANELQFLMNTLKNYLSDETLAMVDTTRRMLCSKAGRGGGIQGDGPDGLAALEELERLGRVYVLCLGDS